VGFHYNPFIKTVVLISRIDNSNIITARPHKPPRHTHYAEFLPGRHYRCSNSLPGKLLNVNGVLAEEYGFPVETATQHRNVKGKAIPLQAWTGPEVSRRLRLPDFKTVGT
jgi:hypothetical protein